MAVRVEAAIDSTVVVRSEGALWELITVVCSWEVGVFVMVGCNEKEERF
jgi:hypothetical protein